MPRPINFPLALLLWPLLLLAVSCDSTRARDADPDPPTSDPVETWTLSPSPLLEIGVREGDDRYQLHRVTGSVRLPNGGILVANAGTRELRLFDEEGRFVRSIGREGEGPGEFRYPSRIRRLPGDSVMVWDQPLRRISFFDTDGEFLGARRLLPSRAVLFPGDEWLHGRTWVDSPLAPEDREPVRRALGALPEADTVGTVRFVRVTDQGWIWVSGRRPPADTAIHWKIYDLQGRLKARVRTPARFQPHETGPDYVLGRFQDEMDVNYVRLYALEKPDGTQDAPDFSPTVASGRPLNEMPERPGVPEEVMAEVRSLVKNMASLQEIHYADQFTYTTDVEALFRNLRGGPPEGVEVEILFAGTDGWMGIFTHRETGAVCGLSYGYYVPMGWNPGEVICP